MQHAHRLHVRLPALQQRALNQLQEVVAVQRPTRPLRVGALPLQVLQHGVRRVHRVPVPLPRVLGDVAVDGGEDDGAGEGVLRLHVGVDAQRHARGVRAHHANGDGLRPLRQHRQQAHLHLRDVKRGDALHVALVEPLHDLLDEVRVHGRRRQDVQEDVAARDRALQPLGARLADAHLQRAQRLHQRLLGRGVGVRDAAGLPRVHRGAHGPHEEAATRRQRRAADHHRLLGRRLVEVDGAVGNGHQADVEVAQPAQLQVVGERGLHKADQRVLPVVEALSEGDGEGQVPEGGVRRGGGLGDGDAGNARRFQLTLEGV